MADEIRYDKNCKEYITRESYNIFTERENIAKTISSVFENHSPVMIAKKEDASVGYDFSGRL